ncbi:oxidoreductase 2OG-Fe(II) oxygenase family [Fusarium sp. NRRL 52700]|nr:oxidoreductase 2OG-Fe(II) oxygenase family [Fusarium sp. NRRL 52700]
MATTAASLSSHRVEQAVPAPVAINASPLLDTSVQALSSSSAIFSFAYPSSKFTIDLPPARNVRIPEALREKLAGDGFNDVLDFFEEVNSTNVAQIMSIMHELIGADLGQVHKTGNLNCRLCDYNMDTADPTSDNGCGTHTDYGTFTIIFQDGTSGLEIEDAEQPGLWEPVPGEATVVLADVEATLRPLKGVKVVRPFTKKVMDGQLDVGEFKEVMGKKWRRREGNEKPDDGNDTETQDSEIESFIRA